MRVLFAGSPQVAVPTLRALVNSSHTVVGVLTQPPRPLGRKRVLTPTAVALAAEAAGVPVVTPRDSEGILDAVQLWKPDVALVVAYGRLLSQAELESVPEGWWNVHFSLLPRWRGAAPVPYSIAAGDTTTGMSVFRIEACLDTGPIASTTEYPIAPHDTTNTVLTKLSELAPALVLAFLDDVESQGVRANVQTGEVSLAPIPSASVGEMSWRSPVSELYNRFRAWHEEPGCYSYRTDTDQRVNILEAWPAYEHAGLEPGQILLADDGVAVGTGTTPLMLGRVQPAGKGPMSAKDWFRGLPPGVRFRA